MSFKAVLYFRELLKMILFTGHTCKCCFLFGLRAVFDGVIAKFPQSNSWERSIVTSHLEQMIRILQQEPKTLLQQRSSSYFDSGDDLNRQAGLLFRMPASLQIDPYLHWGEYFIIKYAIIIDYYI